MLTKTIRIDDEVWAEVQRQARPLEDTPNSVLRRMFGLPEETTRGGRINPRVAKLLTLVQDQVGQTVQWQPHERGYAILGRTGEVVAYLQPQKECLKIAASKPDVEIAGIDSWEKQRQDRFFGCAGVRWFIQDGDDAGYQRAAEVLGKLWNID